MRVALLTLSAILELIASFIYCRSIIRGRTKPHRITRLVLMLILVLGFVGILSAKGNLGAVLYAGISAAFGIACFGLSVRQGMGGSDIFDWVCFTIAMGGVIGWYTTGNAVLGIWLASLADSVAYLPAYLKTWKHPDTESPWLYSLSFLGALLSLSAYRVSSVSIFQVNIMLTSFLMLVCIYHKRIFYAGRRPMSVR
jgi:hypothetical protein